MRANQQRHDQPERQRVSVHSCPRRVDGPANQLVQSLDRADDVPVPLGPEHRHRRAHRHILSLGDHVDPFLADLSGARGRRSVTAIPGLADQVGPGRGRDVAVDRGVPVLEDDLPEPGAVGRWRIQAKRTDAVMIRAVTRIAPAWIRSPPVGARAHQGQDDRGRDQPEADDAGDPEARQDEHLDAEGARNRGPGG